MISRRRALREEYSRVFSDINGARNFQRDGDEVDNCWLSAVLVDPVTAGRHVDDLRAALDAYNIESRPLWKPMHQQRVFAGAGSFLTGAAEQLLATGLTPSAPVQPDSSPRRSSGRIGPGPHRAVVVPDSHATYRATAAISAIRLRLAVASRAVRAPVPGSKMRRQPSSSTYSDGSASVDWTTANWVARSRQAAAAVPVQAVRSLRR